MPQMAPLWWEILYMMFISAFMLTNIIMYWETTMNTTSQSSVNKNKEMMMTWKW